MDTTKVVNTDTAAQMIGVSRRILDRLAHDHSLFGPEFAHPGSGTSRGWPLELVERLVIAQDIIFARGWVEQERVGLFPPTAAMMLDTPAPPAVVGWIAVTHETGPTAWYPTLTETVGQLMGQNLHVLLVRYGLAALRYRFDHLTDSQRPQRTPLFPRALSG